MASHRSSKKSIRKTARQRTVNINRLSRMRTFIKNFEKVVLAKSPVKDIMSVFSAMQKEIMRGVNKRVIHKNAAARKISRMYSKVRSVVEGTSSVKSR